MLITQTVHNLCNQTHLGCRFGSHLTAFQSGRTQQVHCGRYSIFNKAFVFANFRIPSGLIPVHKQRATRLCEYEIQMRRYATKTSHADLAVEFSFIKTANQPSNLIQLFWRRRWKSFRQLYPDNFEWSWSGKEKHKWREAW